jgi:YD repeat-containing protein
VASGAGAADGWSYGYTDLDFLTQATNAGDASLSQSFTYDTAGNLLSNSQVGAYTYPAVGQPQPHTPLTVAGQSYTYDANGNLLTGGGRSYAWDGENRPVTITTAGALTAYTYGPDGARLKKSAKTSPNGVVETTLYLGPDLELASDGTWQKYPHPEVRLTGSGSAVQTAFLHRDHLASVRAVTNASGGVVPDRMARGREAADQVLALDLAGRHRPDRARRSGETALAH